MSYFSAWNEILWLYKETGFRYRAIEITYPIFEDKRRAELKNKDHFITLDVELIEEGTIIYFEPFACTAVKSVIRKHLSKLRAYACTKNLFFFFWPVVGMLPDKSLFRRLTKRCLSLYRSNSNHEPDFFKNPAWISDLLHDWLDTKKPMGTCLLYNTGIKDQITGKAIYEVFSLPCKGKKAIKNAVYYFIFKSPDKGDNIYFQLTKNKIEKADKDLRNK